MKQGNLKRKMSSVVLAVAMIVTTFPVLGTKVHAAELPDSTKFATVDQLKLFDTDETNGINPAKVYFGNNNQQWWIAGSQSKNSMTLFAATLLGESQVFEPGEFGDHTKVYSEERDCDYAGYEVPTEVSLSHYGTSQIRGVLQEFETLYFTEAEQGWMLPTTVFTEDKHNKCVYSTTDKLYLAYGEKFTDFNTLFTYITVGRNSDSDLNSGLRVDNEYWEKHELWGEKSIWLRVPHDYDDCRIHVAYQGEYVYRHPVYQENGLAPAFELDLSSVLFASAASAASSDGQLEIETVNNQDTKGAFTLRYASANGIGSAAISGSNQSVAITSVTNDNTYLVVQNNDGAWSKNVTDGDVVFVSEMSDTLTSFENCKVWLETTNERITYASEAESGAEVNIKIVSGEDFVVTNGIQSNVSGNIEEITVEVADGYYITDEYVSSLQELLNGLTVAKTDNGFTISGTPTSDVNIELPDAAEKTDVIKAEPDTLEFEEAHIGYTAVDPQELTITNTGSGTITGLQVTLVGVQAGNFVLVEEDNIPTELASQGEEKISLKANADLAPGTYKAELHIASDQAQTTYVPINFTVTDHTYGNWKSNKDGTHTRTCQADGCNEKQTANCSGGSSSCQSRATCSVCGEKYGPYGNHSYGDWKSDDKNHWKACWCGATTAKAEHSFGDWVITKEATKAEDGSRERSCSVCEYKETEVIPALGFEPDDPEHPDRPGKIEITKAFTHKKGVRVEGVSENADGYEFSIRKGGDGQDYGKIYDVKKCKYTFKDLKENTRYVIRIRPYHLTDGVRIYGEKCFLTGRVLVKKADFTERPTVAKVTDAFTHKNGIRVDVKSSGAHGYEFYIRKGGENQEYTLVQDEKKAYCKMLELTEGQKYVIRIKPYAIVDEEKVYAIENTYVTGKAAKAKKSLI